MTSGRPNHCLQGFGGGVRVGPSRITAARNAEERGVFSSVGSLVRHGPGALSRCKVGCCAWLCPCRTPSFLNGRSLRSRVVECAQGALFGRILGAQWALRGRSSAQRPRFPGRFDGRSE